MNTPICDFIDAYRSGSPMRLHMPGHKGITFLGCEAMDITEIPGADSLFEANGIIEQSEKNAENLFNCHSFYSTEGSSLCIRSMLYLCMVYATSIGKKPLIAAGRNAHKVLLSAAALLDIDIEWLYPKKQGSYLSCQVTPQELEEYLSSAPLLPTAVYITSPDYLGNMVDIKSISQICHRHNVLLIVDNAHGAYLKFISPSLHPIDLGADLCCDSAHKTLPVLTGGAYLHISYDAPELFEEQAKQAMRLFASTSPSYLILQSLDAVNLYLYRSYPDALNNFMKVAQKFRGQLQEKGFHFIGNEPLKWTLDCKHYGYGGDEMAAYLQEHGIVCEFSDPDFLVMMLSPEIQEEGLKKLTQVLLSIPQKPPIVAPPPPVCKSITVLTPRQAMFLPSEYLPIENCIGRILADPSVGCPPAVPILVCGEQIDTSAVASFQYYGITHCRVCVEI